MVMVKIIIGIVLLNVVSNIVVNVIFGNVIKIFINCIMILLF